MTSIRTHMRAYNLPKKIIKKTNSNYRIEFNTFSTSHRVAVCVRMYVCAVHCVCAHVLVRIEKLDNRMCRAAAAAAVTAMMIWMTAMTITSSSQLTHTTIKSSAEHSVQFRREIHARNTKFAAFVYAIHWLLCHFFVCRLSFSVCFGEVFVSTAFPTCYLWMSQSKRISAKCGIQSGSCKDVAKQFFEVERACLRTSVELFVNAPVSNRCNFYVEE